MRKRDKKNLKKKIDNLSKEDLELQLRYDKLRQVKEDYEKRSGLIQNKYK